MSALDWNRALPANGSSWPIVRVRHLNRKQPFVPWENNQTSINHEGV